jgi:uncharacterized protein
MDEFHYRIAKALALPAKNVKAVVTLINEGATIPFIARYRKEMSGSMDEVQLANISDHLKQLKELVLRKETILKSIKEQGKLTPTLAAKIQQCWDSTTLEDIYLPYKKSRQTKGAMAKKKGLEPLATWLYKQQNGRPESEAKKFLNKEVKNVEDALSGARDIIAEWINEDNRVRDKLRFLFKKNAVLSSKVVKSKKEDAITYKDYFEYSQSLQKCPSHRLLAIRRGEKQGFLRVSIDIEEELAHKNIERYILHNHSPSTKQIQLSIEDAYKRLLKPSIETEFKKTSKDSADLVAMEVFAKNLRQLLLSPPLGSKVILGLDPGFRSGCKVVVINKTGQLLHNSVIYPHPPQNKDTEALHKLSTLIDKHAVEAIAIGNGTAGRETMQLCKKLNLDFPVNLYMVNESGASIYSASKIAREEFPDHDITVRGAVSIARRLMDPLGELVKIDPKSIGVGQYQHDVNQPKLKENLDQVVSSCVNAVGINLNTASQHLLSYVSGLNTGLANNIVGYRNEHGAFTSRKELSKVKRLGPKAFEQAAGFLRIKKSKNPLDNTGIHPERYALVTSMAKSVGSSVEEILNNSSKIDQIKLSTFIDHTIGMPTLKDIINELKRPGLDPRGEAKQFEFSEQIKDINDVKIGMILPGIINNITKFGAFVDIGIKQGGLVHISQIANKFIKDPSEVVSLEQHVNVKVLDVDIERGRIQLSMKDVN